MRKLSGAVAAVLLMARHSVGAADLPPVSTAAPVPLFDRHGLYLGASFAYSQGRTDDHFLNGTQPLPIARNSFKGPMGGLEMGYCGMFRSSVVLCAEVDADFGRAQGTNYAFTALASNTYVVSTTTIDWRVTIGPKLGVAIDQNRLFIFAAAGGAVANVGVDATSTIAGRAGSGSTSGTRGGWFVGAGMERLLTPYLGVTFDYKRLEFSGFDVALTGGTSLHSDRVVDNVFRAGVNVHFGALLPSY